MDAVEQFKQDKINSVKDMTEDHNTKRIGSLFVEHATDYRYCYSWTWMDRPIIQFPQDIVSLQEIIMSVKPDLIIETGIAHGGSLVFSASMLELLDCFERNEDCPREVVGVDIEIRPHNRKAIEEHPMSKRITLFEGSSISKEIVQKVKEIAKKHKTIMVLLDSCHSHEHVLAELESYSSLVSVGSYLVVFDTFVEFQDRIYECRPWGKGNNPYTAVQEFLKQHSEFASDDFIYQKSVITSCIGGWLKRVQ